MRQAVLFALLLILGVPVLADDALERAPVPDGQVQTRVFWFVYPAADDAGAQQYGDPYVTINTGRVDAPILVIHRWETDFADIPDAAGWSIQTYRSVTEGGALADYLGLVAKRKPVWMFTGNRGEAVIVWKQR